MTTQATKPFVSEYAVVESNGNQFNVYNCVVGTTVDTKPTIEEANAAAKAIHNRYAAIESSESRGWTGDGSGTDDLADYNQNEANDYQNE